MGFAIQQGEFVPQQPRRRERRNVPPSTSNYNILEEKIKMKEKINLFIEKMVRKNLISPLASSEDMMR